MILDYFDQDKADPSDRLLNIAIGRGAVPDSCLLGGMIVMQNVAAGCDPCSGCNGPRHKCGGRSQLVEGDR